MRSPSWIKMNTLFTFSVCLLVHICVVFGQVRQEARWCVVNEPEFRKCQDLMMAIQERQARDPANNPYKTLPKLKCVQGSDQFNCMQKISENEADLIALDPGMGYTAGEFFTLMPVMAEKYDLETGDRGVKYYAVGVVRKSNTEINIKTLKGKKSCHTGVGRAAGWVYPVANLIQQGYMDITECNVPVKSASSYFGQMCAPGGLARFYNPFGNNPVRVCELCKGRGDKYCTNNDAFAGYDGAFECMASGEGDVAWVRHMTVEQMTQNSTKYSPTDFELICPDGKRVSYNNAQDCNFGIVSAHIVMTSAIRDFSLRTGYKGLLSNMAKDFGPNGAHKDLFDLFKSIGYGFYNLMFSDATMDLVDVGSKNSYYTWVGADYREKLDILTTCPVRQARWCVISMHEMEKCESMIMAFAAKKLKPNLNCILGVDTQDCMNKIRQGDADLIALDAADVYVAGSQYNLVPVAAEDYSGYNEPTYYAVAVARRTDSHLTIFNLKQRRSCHTAVMSAVGWVVPIDKLIDTEQVRVKECNIYKSLGEFFSKSCVPGILDNTYNPQGMNPPSLCEACAAGGPDRCKRNNEELYYGNSGAFRCLTEYGGDIAFVRHTAVRENTDGRNQAEWARNRRSDDYELLCNDGKRKNIDDWADCNMGPVPANAIVTAHFKTPRERDIYWSLLNYAQQFFSSDDNEDFAMFASSLNYKDLIFQDATVRLIQVPPSKQDYREYLGKRFIRSMHRMTNVDCVTYVASRTTSAFSFSSVVIFIVTFVGYALRR